MDLDKGDYKRVDPYLELSKILKCPCLNTNGLRHDQLVMQILDMTH